MKFKKEQIRYFDLFAGIGGFKVAAENLSNKYNFEHVGFCEIDKQARDFYTHIHANENCQIINDANEIKTKSRKNGIKINDFDLLFAGFPCQSFSNVGYRKGLGDSRGQLFFEILEILDYYKPKYFILENVQKLKTIDKGNVLDEMTDALKNIGDGYNLHIWDLLASDYGLPQNRRRIFFCGIRVDLKDYKELTPPCKVDLSSARYPTTWHLLEKDEVDIKHQIPLKTKKTVLYKNPNWQGDVKIDNPIARPLTASMSKWHRANQDNYFSQTYIDGTNPFERPSVNLDSEPIRRITPLEGFRIQGFPDYFYTKATELQLSYSTQYRLIGNAVPVSLAQSVIEHFLNSYLTENGN